MSVVFERIYRIRSSVALVKIQDQLEMFKTNVRESVIIQIEFQNIIELLLLFNGEMTVAEIYDKNPIFERHDFIDLILFLNENNILIEIDAVYPSDLIEDQYRLINLLEEYSKKISDVLKSLKYIESKSVMVIGLGAVGTWVANSLARSGLKNFTLVDDDKVELSNLHRQDLYFHEDIGRFKIDCVEDRLKDIGDVKIIKIYEKLDINFFKKHMLSCDIVINCADYPSVDFTTNIIGEACMEKEIPHLVGGGYNLHLTLIGQTVIPGKTACIKCFDNALRKINELDLIGVRKLQRPNRKIGSFGPLCALSASLTAIEALKILINKYHCLVNVGKRIEFRVNEQDFFIQEIPRDINCEWCGKLGLFT
jgi:molybdopterin/thiamine biosynthesis adenylyltransferase